MEKKQFAWRLTELRQSRGVSARDMSLSLGQSAGYINNIENGVNLPSMTMFFYICDYLHVTPQEFFDMDSSDPIQVRKLVRESKSLSSHQLALLTQLAQEMKR